MWNRLWLEWRENMPDQNSMMTKHMARQQLGFWAKQAELYPTNPEVLQNYASCLFTVGRNEEALKLYPVAYELNTASAQIAMNYGMVLKDMGNYSESSKLCHHAFCLDPDFFYLKLGWCESLLRNGNWRDAWPYYQDARPLTKFGARQMLGLPDEIEEWMGQKLEPGNNRLFVIGEGGTGDRITYSRWLPELDKRGIEWIYFPDANPTIPGLQSLMERVPWLRGKCRKFGSEGCDITHWTTVFSLPACFDAIPTAIPRMPEPFVPDPERVARYKMQSPDGKPIVGIVWGANELFEGGMKFRSLLESQAMRIVMSTCDIVNWVNCWLGDTHGNNFTMGWPVFNPSFEDWEDTAALLSCCDSIVTTDNGAGWLAQALDKPTSLLLSGNSDWKYLTKDSKSQWHSRTRLFRNEGQGFENAVDKLIMAIRNGEGIGRDGARKNNS